MNQEQKEKIVSDLRKAEISNIQEYLKSLNLSIVEAMLVTREYYQISLGEAKKLVANDKVWEKEAQSGDKLHKELIKKA